VSFTLDEGNHILVPFRLDGAHLTGVLDTGATGFAVTMAAAYHAGVTDDALERDIQIHGTGVNNRQWNGYLHQFGAVELGGTSFHAQQAALVPSSYASRNDALIGSDALLGYSLLKTLRVWISYPSKTLFLQ
jgi:predicted aspartyl protease